MYYLFADGACQPNPGQGGWAYIIKNPDTGLCEKQSGFEPNTTNNRMELTSVFKGLSRLIEICKGGEQVTLTSDSKYLIDSIDVWIHKWVRKNWQTSNRKPVKNKDLLEPISNMRKHFDMKCVHVYGHTGHPENEECDSMAVAEVQKFKETQGVS